LKEILSRQVLGPADNAGELRIADLEMVLNAVLAAKIEFDVAASHLGVTIAQRCQPEAFIFTGIFNVPDARERDLQQADDRGEDALARQSAKRQIRLDASPNPGQHPGKE